MSRQILKAALLALVAQVLPHGLAAQSLEQVKSDVLSALSTPLPITVIGPLLTRDVTVSAEGDGFRATLEDTSLMGLFPFGEVSMKLVAMDEHTYHVSDLQFPKHLDFPGIAQVDLNGMRLDGTWSASERSYSALDAELTGLRMLPGEGDEGLLAIGRLAFDVAKEPDETDMESHFDITLEDVLLSGLDEADMRVGEVRALLSANGEEPVDLYALLREVLMTAGTRDSSAGFVRLGQSLLGNSYGSVELDLGARDFTIVDAQDPQAGFLHAEGLEARLEMQDVEARDWGGGELAVHLEGVQHQDLLEQGRFAVKNALVRLSGADLPVADMVAVIDILDNPRGRPLPLSALLDGLAEFGALELASEGEGLSLDIWDSTFEDDEWIEDRLFTAGYESWGASFALEGLNENRGTASAMIELDGGSFDPGPIFDEADLPHIDAWFPLSLRYGGQVSDLNEGFLKELARDVVILDPEEPVEVILPLALWASATVLDVSAEQNHYETGLFSVEMDADYRVFPAKLMSMVPFEGQIGMRMRGFERLLSHIDGLLEAEGTSASEASAVRSALIVLRNLGEQDEDGALAWQIEKPDVDSAEIAVNGTTLYYPEPGQIMPLAFLGSMGF